MRGAVAIAAAAGLVLSAAGCGGSRGSHLAELGGTSSQSTSPSDTSTSAHVNGALAFSRCMRSHGVPQFPDPDSRGAIPKVGPQQLQVSNSELRAAQTSCGYLLHPTGVQVQQTLSGMLAFSRCMRSHGIRNWPDPTTTSDGQAVFDLRAQINPDTPRLDTTSGECAHLLQPAPGQNGTVLCNGIGEAGCHHYG